MAAGKLNLVIEKGATFNQTFLYKDSAGVAISLTGYEARMQIRDNIESSATLVDLTSSPAAGITLEPTETGEVVIKIGADVTDTLGFTSAVYDLELYVVADPTEVIRLVQGAVTLKLGVTR